MSSKQVKMKIKLTNRKKMSLAERIDLTVDEYLQGRETAESKHEYPNREVWPMFGATDSHITLL